MSDGIELKKKHFDYFKKQCNKWIEKFKLDDWDFYFNFKLFDGAWARTNRDVINHIAVITLCNNWEVEVLDNLNDAIASTAKHEITHILISNIAQLAYSRFVTEDEVVGAEEACVIKLCKLL